MKIQISALPRIRKKMKTMYNTIFLVLVARNRLPSRIAVRQFELGAKLFVE
jgi:hypothetical protein